MMVRDVGGARAKRKPLRAGGGDSWGYRPGNPKPFVVREAQPRLVPPPRADLRTTRLRVVRTRSELPVHQDAAPLPFGVGRSSTARQRFRAECRRDGAATDEPDELLIAGASGFAVAGNPVRAACRWVEDFSAFIISSSRYAACLLKARR